MAARVQRIARFGGVADAARALDEIVARRDALERLEVDAARVLSHLADAGRLELDLGDCYA